MNTDIDFKAFEKAITPRYRYFEVSKAVTVVVTRNHCMYQDNQYILSKINFDYFKENLTELIAVYLKHLIKEKEISSDTTNMMISRTIIERFSEADVSNLQKEITQCLWDNIPVKALRIKPEEWCSYSCRDLLWGEFYIDYIFADVFEGIGERLFEIIDSYRNHITDLLAFKVVSIPQDENNNIEGHENVVVECDFDNAEPLPGREVINTPAITTADIVAISIIVAMMIFVGWLFYHYLIGY